MNDNVNHPSHYTSGRIEVIDFIEDQKLPYHLGNVVKYVSRAGKKDPTKTVEDLEKARWYLDRYIKTLKSETEQTDQFRDGTKKIEPSQTERCEQYYYYNGLSDDEFGYCRWCEQTEYGKNTEFRKFVNCKGDVKKCENPENKGASKCKEGVEENGWEEQFDKT